MRSLPSALQNLFIVFGIFGGLLLCGADPADKSPDNLAFGRPYTNRFLPNYTHCTDPGDVTQLTDGVRTQGYFWTQKTTVGWTRIPFVEFTIDLGSDKPIRGVSLNSAAGTAGVRWPNSIRILLSTDGTRFHFVGDLIKMSGGKSAAPTGYAIQRFVTEALETHGRYVKFVIEADGTMVFADEVEVLRGEDGWLKNPLPGEGVVFGPIYFEDPFNSSLKGRVGQDLETVRQELDESKLAEGARGHFASEITKLDEEIRKAPPTAPAAPQGNLLWTGWIRPVSNFTKLILAVDSVPSSTGGLLLSLTWSTLMLSPRVDLAFGIRAGPTPSSWMDIPKVSTQPPSRKKLLPTSVLSSLWKAWFSSHVKMCVRKMSFYGNRLHGIGTGEAASFERLAHEHDFKYLHDR